MASKLGPWKRAAPGIYFRTQPGRKHGARLDRYYVLRHSPHGTQITEVVGWASDGWTLARAQAELSRLLEAKRTGNGPRTLREEREAHLRAEQQRHEDSAARARQQKTVADLWDRYSKEVVAIDNKPPTIAQKARRWRKYIEPALGRLQINDVTTEDCSAVIRAPLRLNSAGQVIGGKGQAAVIYRLLHHMFRKALSWSLRQRQLGNPLEDLAEPRVPRRERLLSGGEVGALLRALDTAAEQPQIIAVIRTAILTGARISELLNLQWQHIRREEMELHLPDTKTGFSRRPISDDALAVLDSMEQVIGIPFVFRGITNSAKPLLYSTVEKAFHRITEAAGINTCTLHTIRHWFATMTANSVSNQRVGMALTGHKSHPAYMRYVHSDKEQAHSLAKHLATLTNTLWQNGGDNVREMPKRKSRS